MLVCCSSGATARYRKDILRAIAMPAGSHLQFRYDFEYVDPVIQQKFSDGKWTSSQKTEGACLICYCDQSDPTQPVELVPCRYATIVDVEELGTSFSLTLALEKFAYTDDLRTFQTQLNSASSNKIPHWPAPNETIRPSRHSNIPAGFHWVETNLSLDTARETEELAEWQGIVRQLQQRTDFKTEAAFYTVRGIRKVTSKCWAIQQSGVFELKPGQEYEMMVYHFHPSLLQTQQVLGVSSSNAALVSFITGQTLIFDSPYDSYHVRFQTRGTARDEIAVFSITRSESGQSGSLPPVPAGQVWEFDLSLRVRRVFWPTVGKGCFAGFFLWIAFVLEVLRDSGSASEGVKSSGIIPLWLVLIGSLLCYLLVGLAAAFHFEKPIGD